jgi:integrase/recombinase XerD
MNILDLCARYIRSKVLRESTVVSYHGRAGCFYKVWQGDVSEITEEHVIAYRDSLLLNNRSAATWNSDRRHLIAMMTYACKHNLAFSNPFKEIGRARENPKPKLVQDTDFLVGLNWITESADRNVPHYFWTALFLTLTLTGMRRAQLVGLSWIDMDFEPKNPSILLRAEHAKSGKRNRVPMCRKLFDELTTFRELSRTLWPLSESTFLQTQVFNLALHKTGNVVYSSLLKSQVSQFFSRLQIDSKAKLSAHRLRHTAITKLLRIGTPLRDVQEIAGHASANTTMLYSHPSMELARAGFDKLADVQPGVSKAHVTRER